MTGILLTVYCILIVSASVIGGWLPAVIRMTHLRTQLLMSFVAGLMLGIAMLHMMPHASNLLQSASHTGAAMLGGIIAMFLLLRAFHTHQHGEVEQLDHHPHVIGDEAVADQHVHDDDDVSAKQHSLGHVHDHDHQHDHDHHGHGHSHGHAHSHDHGHDHAHDHGKELGWLGMLFGLGLHTMMDGVALAASVVAEQSHRPWLGLAGLGTFLAVALHKPLDAFAITSMMRKDGWTPSQRGLVNLTFSAACPLGAMLFYLGATHLAHDGAVLGWGLAISAGFFVCISLSDLLPEVSFHNHDRVKLTAALLIGVALAVAIESLPNHQHEHDHRAPTSVVAEVSPPQ